jgi:hypothetical protein
VVARNLPAASGQRAVVVTAGVVMGVATVGVDVAEGIVATGRARPRMPRVMWKPVRSVKMRATKQHLAKETRRKLGKAPRERTAAAVGVGVVDAVVAAARKVLRRAQRPRWRPAVRPTPQPQRDLMTMPP